MSETTNAGAWWRPCLTGGLLLGVVAAYALVVRLLWVGAIHDFDTDVQILGYWVEGRPVLACPAHPLPFLIDLIFALAAPCGGVRVALFGSLALALLGTCLLLYRWCRQGDSAPWLALVVLLAYLLSPAVLNLAHRTEENLLFHPLLLGSLFGSRMVAMRSEVSVWQALAAAGCLLLLGWMHLQPFLVVFVAHLVYVSLRAWRQRGGLQGMRPGWRRRQWILLSLPLAGIVVTVLQYQWVPYQEHYYSLFSAADVPLYLRIYLAGVVRFLVRVVDFIGYDQGRLVLLSGGGIVVLGAAMVVGMLGLVLRYWGPQAAALGGAMGLVLLYEPISSERWDTVLLCLLVLLVSIRRSGLALVVLVSLVLANLSSLPSSWALAQRAAQVSLELDHRLPDVPAIYIEVAAAAPHMRRFPHRIELRALGTARPSVGDVLCVLAATVERLAAEGIRLRPLGIADCHRVTQIR